MTFRFPILILILSGCATAPQRQSEPGCMTSCGLMAPLATQCAELQNFEDSVLQEFSRRVGGWEYSRTCDALQGWSVYVWPNVDHRGVLLGMPDNDRAMGRTYIERKTIYIASERWGDTALAHEMAHVMRWTFAQDPSHDDWKDMGICTAINMASDHFHCNYQNPGEGWLQR